MWWSFIIAKHRKTHSYLPRPVSRSRFDTTPCPCIWIRAQARAQNMDSGIQKKGSWVELNVFKWILVHMVNTNYFLDALLACQRIKRYLGFLKNPESECPTLSKVAVQEVSGASGCSSCYDAGLKSTTTRKLQNLTGQLLYQVLI